MSERRLLELIGDIDDELIESAADHVSPKKKVNRALVISLVAAAACVAIVCAAVFMKPRPSSDRFKTNEPDIVMSMSTTRNTFSLMPNTAWNQSISCEPVSKVELQIDEVTDSQIRLSYIVTDSGFEGEFYTYDGLFRLLSVDDTRMADFSFDPYHAPLTQPAEGGEKIGLDSPQTEFVFDYADIYGPLAPGDYYLFGYIYSYEGSGLPIWITVQFTVPEQ